MLQKILIFLYMLAMQSGTTAQLSDDSWQARAEILLSTAVAQNQCIGISAGFNVGTRVTWSFGAGLADQEAQTPFTAVTPTRIASVTKPFTAVAIMQLYEQGKLELDIAIQKYLPEFPVQSETPMTIRHLLTHTSGITGYSNDKERENKIEYASLSEAVNIFKQRDLLFDPGSAFNYTTYGYDLLGLIIERVSGLSYEVYLQQNIWDPAEMLNTGIEHAGFQYDRKSQLYHRQENGKIKYAKPTNLSDRIPGGGIYSTVDDMLKFSSAILNDVFISEESFKFMLQDSGLKKEGNGYGFGWYLYGVNPNYGNVIGHTGEQTGCSAICMLLPEVHTGIVVLSNTSGAMQEVSNIAVKLFDLAAEAAGN